jgi:site-specific DNA-methyltransferase (adenine-specific)
MKLSDNINAYNNDCMEFMKDKPDNYYDLAIVDPPYGIKQGGDKNYTRGKLAAPRDYHCFNDDNAPSPSFFDELRRVSHNQIIWGANHFIDSFPFMCNSPCWIVWDKDNTGDFADCELAWTSFKSAVRIFKWRWNGMLQQNMAQKDERIHPTQKPVQLYRWLLKNYAKQGDKILDTHGGSFSSAIACHKEGFALDICEIDKEYFDEAVKRFRLNTVQRELF